MATPKLNIPERLRLGVSKIRRLDERTVQEIKKALDKAGEEPSLKDSAGIEISRDPDAVAIAAVRSVASLNLAEFAQIAESLAGLYTAKSMRDVPLEEFLDSVSDAMENLSQEELRVPHSEREQFKDKLRPLLSSEFFSIVAKAYDLVTEERTFCSARILTDLRPVFGLRVEDGPQAMVVMHTLKLVYHEGSKRHEEFFVALDADDLKTLRKLVDRAEAKAETLRPAVKDLRLFGLSRE
jgi:hypothetical protein